jgi:hypothetical protein
VSDGDDEETDLMGKDRETSRKKERRKGSKGERGDSGRQTKTTAFRQERPRKR